MGESTVIRVREEDKELLDEVRLLLFNTSEVPYRAVINALASKAMRELQNLEKPDELTKYIEK